MTIYQRDEILPEWEPAPWPMDAHAADKQEQGFHRRSQMPIDWQSIPWKAFPTEGIFGHSKEWLSDVDAAFFATFEGEDLLLIDNTWFGWPDPPRWGLASRPHGHANMQWERWGYFPELPPAWQFAGAANYGS